MSTVYCRIKTIVISLLPLLFTGCSYTFYQTECDYPLPGLVRNVSQLPGELNETSGLEVTENRFITFNDSGGEAALYCFRGNSILHKTILKNTFNVDWESIASDSSFYYVADVGNNRGRRDTLIIYKIPENALNAKIFRDSVKEITISYAEKVYWSEEGRYSHDCEALLQYGDSLYFFTKDWASLSSRVYSIPKMPGHYSVKSIRQYDVKALITGADIDPFKKEVTLVGYRRGYPIMIKYGFQSSPGQIECGGKARKYYKLFGTQVEGVSYGNDGYIYFTSEKRFRKQAIYRTY
ncbi:MAG TPA: hypothetical protein VJ951_01055 [Bacteroidales bacterium]|nr:hypothetical protein [Bacteroidales bacterium]